MKHTMRSGVRVQSGVQSGVSNGCGPGVGGLHGVVPDTLPYRTFWVSEDFHFGSACDKHDACYASSGRSRWDCDFSFYQDLLSECRKTGWPDARAFCEAAAWTYYQAVDKGGFIAYEP